jgi:serine/threonine protein kinase
MEVDLAIVKLKHARDAESAEAAQAQLRALKLSLVEVQRESTAAVIELAAHLYDFPELRLRFPKARLDDLFAAGGDASALRTLDQYDNRVVIAETRHTVESASFGGVECTLKLFRLASANQRAFVKEARRLRQLAHPNVVEVRAVFVDGQVGVIEMPLYKHGDLWKWLAAAPRTVHDKLRVLRAALCGLEHVHRMGVVHADVKPENVFVDSDGVAKLGDFDVSKDDVTRVTMVGTVVGFSLAYAAPEIKNGADASKVGDMYAFGLTLFDIVRGEKPIAARPVNVELLARHEPIENGSSLRDLVRRLIVEASGNRVSATDALASPLLAPPPPVAILHCISASVQFASNHAGSTKASSVINGTSFAASTSRRWRSSSARRRRWPLARCNVDNVVARRRHGAVPVWRVRCHLRNSVRTSTNCARSPRVVRCRNSANCETQNCCSWSVGCVVRWRATMRSPLIGA